MSKGFQNRTKTSTSSTPKKRCAPSHCEHGVGMKLLSLECSICLTAGLVKPQQPVKRAVRSEVNILASETWRDQRYEAETSTQ
jgi:hypothetical protein